MNWPRTRLMPLWIGAGAVAAACLLAVLSEHLKPLEILQRLEWITYDWRVREALRHPVPVSDKLAFVAIDDAAVAIFDGGLLDPEDPDFQFGLLWPRQIYGRVVRELSAQGARAIGLDVLFEGPRPDHRPVQTAQGAMSSDAYFRAQLRRAGNVVLGTVDENVPHPDFRGSALALGDISTDRDSDGVLRRARPFRDYRVWHPEIKSQAILNNWRLDQAEIRAGEVIFSNADGTVFAVTTTEDGYFDPSQFEDAPRRRGVSRLPKAFEEIRVWHMGIVLAAAELGLDLAHARVEPERRRVVLPGTNGVGRVIPVDRQGFFLIDWTVPHHDPRLTTDAFHRLVADGLRRDAGTNIAARFRDKLVIVGSTATGNNMSDIGATPLEKETFLTGNNWNVLNSVLSGRFIQRGSTPAVCGWIIALGLLGALLTWKLPPTLASFLVLLLGVAYALLAAALFVRFRHWVPVVMPLGSMLAGHMALLTYQAFFEQTERRRIKNVFAKLVSPNVVNELLKAKHLSLVGGRREVTVFFADIRGFTEMTDLSQSQAEAEVRARQLNAWEAEALYNARSKEVLDTVNLYLGAIADVVKQHEGTLDKYIGDCVMAFWGAPTPNERHAVSCVRAAIDTQRVIHQLNQRRTEENRRREQENAQRAVRGEPPLPLHTVLSVGTGINTGMVTAGVMGSDAHILNYTVFGREVNVAARLESASGRGRILVGETTYRALQRDDPALAAGCVELPPVAVKGIRAPVKVFEVMWQVAEASGPEESLKVVPAA